eukprot:CAMPEP_0204451548 /NCGR_PEP_ID=MMETSP0470-20130426/100908_1 /ASSEMBLY_ACC=CAM_ASM_000385 /TAXON_ID=2969 /ORGANISM="Oxyrrhis marina" /LENGTH=78 /DNA_ID=CAMNT_0051451393 /DNA_START=155 /DNA_END=391 /DNA_ORIENTATION=+
MAPVIISMSNGFVQLAVEPVPLPVANVPGIRPATTTFFFCKTAARSSNVHHKRSYKFALVFRTTTISVQSRNATKNGD